MLLMQTAQALDNDSDERLLSRKQVAKRWRVSTETIKRRGREGLLPPLRFNQRLIRYRLADVIRVEQQAAAQQSSQ